MLQVVGAVKGITGREVEVEQPLMEAGLDSLGAVELKNALEVKLGKQLPSTMIFDYPTASSLASFLTRTSVPLCLGNEDFVS